MFTEKPLNLGKNKQEGFSTGGTTHGKSTL
jgi:hypothetical protein